MSDFCNHCKQYFDDDIAWEDDQTGLMFCSEECLDVHFNDVEANTPSVEDLEDGHA